MLKKYGISLAILFISFSYIVGLDFLKLTNLDLVTLAITALTMVLSIYNIYIRAKAD